MKGIILQEVLLNQVRKDQTKVTVSLLNGEKCTGLVKGFDSFTVLLDVGENQTLLYKHAIASVKPEKFVSLSQRKA